MSKREIRKRVATLISHIGDTCIESESDRIALALFQMPCFQRCNSISVYLNMAKEVRTAKVLDKCFQLGKQVYVPRISNDGTRMSMIAQTQEQVAQLVPRGKYGILEPEKEFAAVEPQLDLIIVPGVAFTKQCARLGHGKGYYDRYIKLLPQRPVLVGIGLSEQLVDSIPLEPHDEFLDYVIIDGKVYAK